LAFSASAVVDGLDIVSASRARRMTMSSNRDPIETDPDKYKVVFENERVRVLEYRDTPGQKTSPHYHPDYVLYAVTSFRRNLTLPLEGKGGTRDVQAGDVVWGKAQVHIGENVGSTDTHVIMVELKGGGSV
jgi:quercetin dioxygenase-like cupin family protein